MNILIVDNDLEYSNFLKSMILNNNKYIKFNIEIENDSEKAYDLCTSNLYEIVIYDVFMTKINGIAFLKDVKLLNTNLIFILVSLVYDERLRLDAMINGASNYFKKNSYYTIINEILNIALNKERIKNKQI